MTNFASRALALIPFSLRDRIKGLFGISHLQRAIVSLTLEGREFVHVVDAGPAKGITFVVKMPEDKGIWTGTYEIEFATRLAASVTRGTVAYDIGSWHGFFAGVMASQGAAHVHVFEPLPTNAERICRLIALNPDRPITLHEIAVGDHEIEMYLLVMPETSMAKLEESTFRSDSTSSERIRVKVRSIDAMILAGEIAPPSLMKIDVEGAEAMVLYGARKTIRDYRPIIFAEVHSPALLDECSAFLEAEGYNIETIGYDLTDPRSNDVFQIKASPSRSA